MTTPWLYVSAGAARFRQLSMAIPENICSSRAFLRLTEADILVKIVCAKTEALLEKFGGLR